MKYIPLFLCFLLAGCQPKGDNLDLLNAQIEALQKMESGSSIHNDDLTYWDQVAEELIRKDSSKRDGDSTRLYAYLYVAQKQFADASFFASGGYLGTLDPISLGVIRLFFPNYEGKKIQEDAYSEKLASIILQNLKSRYAQEERDFKEAALSDAEDVWKAEIPVGLESPSIKPWKLQSGAEFRSPSLPPLNHPFWKKQADQVKRYIGEAGEKEKEKVLFWATMVGESDWKTIAEKYMAKNKVSLETRLDVREKLAIAISDALLAVFDSKYALLIKRPNMLDSKLKTKIPTPDHPSYPSAHSTISAAAATILCYYFPENRKNWWELAHEAGMSRLWGGIHYPIDNEMGLKQGAQVGKAVLFR